MKSKTPMQRRMATLVTATSLAVAAPVSAGWDGWSLLQSVEVKEVVQDDLWRAQKSFPPELRAATEGFEVRGFYVPIQAEPYIQRFLVVQDPADCPFCGGSGYGPSLEVHLKKPMADIPEFSEITVKGDLDLIDDPDTYQAYILRGAVVMDGQ